MPEVGEVSPDFTLLDNKGETVALADLRGKTVVLFFYPKADTPGCTIEACSFRDAKANYDEADVVILGISPDTVRSQERFATKFEFPYRLLADHDHAVAEAYGVWAEKSMYGKKYMGIDRTSFVIGPDGTLSHVFRKVKVDAHADEVLKALKTSY